MRTSKPKLNETIPAAQAGGATLRTWIDAHFDVAGVEPLVDQLIALSERLIAVRAELAKKGVDGRLINAETKLLSQYTSLWKLAGFADPEVPSKRGGYTGPPMQRIRR